MKQVTYDFSIRDILFNLLVNISTLEDGYWQLFVTAEYVSAFIPSEVIRDGSLILPSYSVRMNGLRLVKVDKLDINTIEVRGGMIIQSDPLPIQGEIFDGPDRNQNGSDQGSQSSGENSGEVGQGVSGS